MAEFTFFVDAEHYALNGGELAAEEQDLFDHGVRSVDIPTGYATDLGERIPVRVVGDPGTADADIDALHVQLADEAVHIGPAPATASYLDSGKVIDAARTTDVIDVKTLTLTTNLLDLQTTGALGLEALSRGALRATFVERGREALLALRANVETLGLGIVELENGIRITGQLDVTLKALDGDRATGGRAAGPVRHRRDLLCKRRI